MSNTYTQIHIHTVFAVQYRTSLINERWEAELYKYITGIIEKHEHKMLHIGGMSDHIHVLIGLRPNQSLSDLMFDIKRSSSLWINKNGYAFGKFKWQEGYSAFSYGKSQVAQVIKYIHDQKEHHQHKSFRDENIEFLKKFEIEYDERYVLKEPE